MEIYLNYYIKSVCSPSFVNLTLDKHSANPSNPGRCSYLYEWWCNTNNHLDLHIDKDEVSCRENGRYSLPLLSTGFYPHVSCTGGELLVADNPPIQEGQTGPPPRFHSSGSESLSGVFPGNPSSHQPTRRRALFHCCKHLAERTPHHAGFSTTGLNFSTGKFNNRTQWV